MNKGYLLLLLSLAFYSSHLSAQNSCPIIEPASYHIVTDASNTCLRQVSFNFTNPTSGAKVINVVVKVNGVQVINNCVDASGQMGVLRNYTSAQFTACSIAAVEVVLTPYTASACGSTSSCAVAMVSIGGAPLPVIFASFTAAKITKSSVLLKWETVTELNNRGFFIERNTNNSWETVGFVATLAFDGGSSSRLAYQFADMNYNKGMTQYRLRQTDFDGQVKYSEIRTIRGDEQPASTIVFPNPSSDGKVNILFQDANARDISLCDMTGRIIKQWNAYQQNSLQLNIALTGMYTIRSVDRASGTVSVEKILVNAR
jgi:hypothetical protein